MVLVGMWESILGKLGHKDRALIEETLEWWVSLFLMTSYRAEGLPSGKQVSPHIRSFLRIGEQSFLLFISYIMCRILLDTSCSSLWHAGRNSSSVLCTCHSRVDHLPAFSDERDLQSCFPLCVTHLKKNFYLPRRNWLNKFLVGRFFRTENCFKSFVAFGLSSDKAKPQRMK